eukprot:57334-Pelagomonas_calceolata.AAC.1
MQHPIRQALITLASLALPCLPSGFVGCHRQTGSSACELPSLSFMAISGGAARRSSGACVWLGLSAWNWNKLTSLMRLFFVACGMPCTYGSCSRGCCSGVERREDVDAVAHSNKR